MFIFLSNFPDFCPHLYILLWGGGLQNMVWNHDFVPAKQRGLGRVPVLTLHVIPMPWHTDSWKLVSNTLWLWKQRITVFSDRKVRRCWNTSILDACELQMALIIVLHILCCFQFLPRFVSLKPALTDSGNQKPPVMFPANKFVGTGKQKSFWVKKSSQPPLPFLLVFLEELQLYSSCTILQFLVQVSIFSYTNYIWNVVTEQKKKKPEISWLCGWNDVINSTFIYTRC